MSRLVFLNLPVADLEVSRAFFTELGFSFDPRFTDESCACMVIDEQAWCMLIARERFAAFTSRPIADGTTTEAITCLSAGSREGVDELADTALAHGATPANEPTDNGFMYGRSFHDPDGHLREVMWMSQEAVEAGPADVAGWAA